MLENTGSVAFDTVDHMVENVIGVFPEPLGMAVNFQINGKDYLIPMATEEPSVIAAAMLRRKNGSRRRRLPHQQHRANHDWANPSCRHNRR